MSRVLLDTHALLWALTEPRRLSKSVRSLLGRLETEVCVSSVSAYEIARKHQLGRLGTAAAVVEGYGGHLRTLRADELQLSSMHALLAARLPTPHRDPFDRLIAAQSLIEDIPVVTRDEAIAALGASTIW
jgi:PIN domain nuclease of toxin-antitoxin system